MKYAYFPGCSLKGTGRSYEESLLPVMRALGVELDELHDWNCCGATAYMSVDEVKACVLASRNLAIAEKTGHKELMTPCSACYLVLNKTQHYLHDTPSIKNAIGVALRAADLSCHGKMPVRHPLDVLVNDVGLEAIKKKVTRPLKGLKIAPYYGCQIVRPYATFDDAYQPTTMDRLCEALGATVVRYPLKTRCCGGSLTGISPEPGLDCVYQLLKEAVKRGADMLVTTCPLCQFNLDSYHDQIAARWEPVRVPTLYFTQLMGLAFGMAENELGLQRHSVPIKAQSIAAAA
jgi:heterodisulfide reductase subunit B2